MSGRHKKENVTKERTAWELEMTPSIFSHSFSQRSSSVFPAPHRRQATITAAFVSPIPGSSLHSWQNEPSIWQIRLFAMSSSSATHLFKKYLLSTYHGPVPSLGSGMQPWKDRRDPPYGSSSLDLPPPCPPPLPSLPLFSYLGLQNKDPSGFT